MWSPFADPTSFQRMTALDAGFLHAESERTPLHIGALCVFDGAPFFDEKGAFRLDDVRARVAERLHLFPRFRKRVATVPFGQGRPVWVDDTEFDIANHVKVMVLPEPGSREELAAACARLHMHCLDRNHPLWELWFVGGLDDGNVAMVEKVHHAMIDGVSGVDVASALLDLSPDALPPTVPDWEPVPPPDPIPLLAETLRERLVEPAEWARTLRAMLRGPAGVARRVNGLLDGVTSFGSPASLHRSSLNQPVGDERRLDWATVPLEQVRATAHDHGATVNDVVLAAMAGGFRALLHHRHEGVAHRQLHALVPVSLRSDSEQLALGNRVSGIVAPLPLGRETPVQRLEAVRDAMARHKARHQADGTELLMEGIEMVPPALLPLASRIIHRQPLFDVVVTNVPGPPFPLYFLGARMLESIPVVPLGGNLTVGVAILSYDGQLTVGVFADRDQCPDLDVLMGGIRNSFDDLVSLAVAS